MCIDEAGEGSALADGADSAVAVQEKDWGWGFDCAVLEDLLLLIGLRLGNGWYELYRQPSHISYNPPPCPSRSPPPSPLQQHLFLHLRNTNLRHELGIGTYVLGPIPHLRFRSAVLT
jgi:hypothetical protein